MRRPPAVALPCALIAALTLAGCGGGDDAGPPVVHYGDSLCAQCGMILSDERFATATMTTDERGRPAPLLFDDFNCQKNHELIHPDAPILARWVHDHADRRWIDARGAFFVYSPELRTPMASHTAAFASPDAAREAARQWRGRVLTFEELWAADSFDFPRADPGGAPGEEPESGSSDRPSDKGNPTAP